MVTFNFIEFGENLGTRPLGKHIREQLVPLLEQEELAKKDKIHFTNKGYALLGDLFFNALMRLDIERE